MNLASSRRINPGGLPCLDLTSSQSPLERTTLMRVPAPICDSTRDDPDGSSYTDVALMVSYTPASAARRVGAGTGWGAGSGGREAGCRAGWDRLGGGRAAARGGWAG